jgi:1,4-alpha-glucan branching enzyme
MNEGSLTRFSGLTLEGRDLPLPTAIAGDPAAVRRLIAGELTDPHALLGAHPMQLDNRAGVVVRAYHPGAKAIALIPEGGGHTPMDPVDPAGLFAVFLPEQKLPFAYELEIFLEGGTTFRRIDPYRFMPTLGELDLHLSGEGRHYRLYEKLGAHLRVMDGVEGTSFAVWAPNARRVSVVGSFNGWDGRLNPMRAMGSSGIWELFVPGVGRGALYKFELKIADGNLRIKTDPFAYAMELRPKSASVVWGLPRHQWGDAEYMAARARRDARHSPMAIYEVHIGSWMRGAAEGGRWLTYREMAPRLVDHVKAHGFTHIELLPIAEHAYDPSWGYQTTGYFAPTCRYGTPEDFCFLVDLCHQNGIGVILDWVPAHFPKDDWGLRWFDGTALYEHADPKEGEHRDWGTLIFNYGRNEVRGFLLSNAVYWLDQFHVDGLRVDAVASMLYRNYSRKEGEWIPNIYGGRENLEAISFLQEMNALLYQLFPGIVTIAEESTAWGGVTAPTYLGGLGFAFKWNMGWMHDTLSYFSKDPVHRKYHQNDLTFSMLYEYTENFVMPLSHDEVVHLKGSLWGKMPGDDWQKAANLRLLFTYLYTHPGKKLVFMGGEYGQSREWNADYSLDWHEAGEYFHAGVQRLYKELGRIYLEHDALWFWDHEPRGFRWIDCKDTENSVLSFVRWGPSGHLVCVFNMTPVPRHEYRIGMPQGGRYRELLNSDGESFCGSNVGNNGIVQTDWWSYHGFEHSAALTLPPLGALILEPESPSTPSEESER